jgi:signal transduction histidine kinase
MKITVRLWLYIIAIVAAVLALIWYFLVLTLPGAYTDEAVAALDTHADIILQLWESGEPAEGYARENALRAEARRLDGELELAVGWEMDFEILAPSELEQVARGQYITKKYLRPGHGETLLLAKPVYIRGSEPSILVVCMPMAPVEAAQELLNRQMVTISLVSLAIALGIAFLASQMFLRPIRVIERMANAISEGDFSRRINSKDSSELGELARAIDNMAERLGSLEAMRRDFIATVSHQFKTPLSIIQGHAELVQDTLPEETAALLAPSFEVMSDEIARLDRMSRDILKLSQLQSGFSLTLAPLPLAP